MNVDFKLAKYEFHLTAREDIRLPRYSGSTLRGGFGRAFRNTVCAARKPECSECMLKGNCIFPRIFDTEPPQDWERMPKQSKAPRPFVIEPPMDGKPVYRSGETIVFGLILFGYAGGYLPYFIYSFQELGRNFGLGSGRGRFELAEVRSVSLNGSQAVYSHDDKLLRGQVQIVSMDAICEAMNGCSTDFVRLDFVTPTRITRLGQLVTGSSFQFESFMRAVFRRASMLASLFCGSEWELDYSSLLKQAGEVRAEAVEHHVQRWERYSARQGARLQMTGFTGEVRLAGDLGHFLPFIKLGELIHVGKSTTFGMGRYVVQDVT